MKKLKAFLPHFYYQINGLTVISVIFAVKPDHSLTIKKNQRSMIFWGYRVCDLRSID